MRWIDPANKSHKILQHSRWLRWRVESALWGIGSKWHHRSTYIRALTSVGVCVLRSGHVPLYVHMVNWKHCQILSEEGCLPFLLLIPPWSHVRTTRHKCHRLRRQTGQRRNGVNGQERRAGEATHVRFLAKHRLASIPRAWTETTISSYSNIISLESCL